MSDARKRPGRHPHDQPSRRWLGFPLHVHSREVSEVLARRVGAHLTADVEGRRS